MSQTLIVSTDQRAPGQWQGCLRAASFDILWRCAHKHTGSQDAVECAKAERERRLPTPVHTGPAPEGATHIGKESGSFYRPDDENHLVQIYRRGRWVDEAMHASNLLVSSSFITVRGAPPREKPAEHTPTASHAALHEQQQQMLDFGTPAEEAA
jgi:hypothetical protein